VETRPAVWRQRAEWTGMARLALMLATALAITNLGLPQSITGPLVNALLLLTVEWCGVSQAILVGMVTPMGAALRGVLPLPLLIMIPFIALGNAAMTSVYGALRERNRWVALVSAAVAKFALMYAAVTLLSVRPLSLFTAGGSQSVSIPVALAAMMTWPQLATALAGGLIAFGICGLHGRRRGKAR
jgi:hypothetical protein